MHEKISKLKDKLGENTWNFIDKRGMALIYKELLKVERQKHKNHAEKRANDKKNSSPKRD